MFYQADKIIVFQIDRKLPFDYERPTETDVAFNDMEDADLDLDVASADTSDVDLELDNANMSLINNNNDKDYEVFEEKISMTYNISEPDRSKVQSRAEYRRTHLRPNGKPYED